MVVPLRTAYAEVQPEDFPVPYGHFYTQATPGLEGGQGFSITDAGGIAFWSEFLRLGGVTELGYPLSRRFALDGEVYQLVQGGLLRWEPHSQQAHLLPAEEGPPVPAYALEPEEPPRAAGGQAVPAWSGWWWPAHEAIAGPRLHDSGGPLAKYDRYVRALGLPDPGTRQWELNNVRVDGSRFPWAGHCNGWAAAALLEPEPVEDREVGGVLFTVADLKGLLSDYHFADAAAWVVGGEEGVDPVSFHRTLLAWMRDDGRGLIMTFVDERGGLWSLPAYAFESVWGPDPIDPLVVHVRTTVWMADFNVPADFVGSRPWPGPGGKVFQYTLTGDPAAPSHGDWEGVSLEGAFARPWQLWYPEPRVRNLDRPLTSPALDYALIQRLLRDE